MSAQCIRVRMSLCMFYAFYYYYMFFFIFIDQQINLREWMYPTISWPDSAPGYIVLLVDRSSTTAGRCLQSVRRSCRRNRQQHPSPATADRQDKEPEKRR